MSNNVSPFVAIAVCGRWRYVSDAAQRGGGPERLMSRARFAPHGTVHARNPVWRDFARSM
jgi:hypothetical protein